MRKNCYSFNQLIYLKKRLLLLILGLVWVPLVLAQENWKWQNPIPQGNHLHGIHVFDDQSILISGEAGTIIRTSDIFETYSVEFLPDSLVGRTRDLIFINNSVGFIIGDNGYNLKSTDGGQTWRKGSISTNYSLNRIHFFDELVGVIVGAGGSLYLTEDGGENWQLLTTNTIENLYGVRMVSSIEIWAVGNNGTVIKSFDRGQNFTVLTVGTTSSALSDIEFTSTYMYISGPSGAYRSDNKVNFQSMGISPYTSRIHFINDSEGYIAGYNRVFKTNDRGDSWSSNSFDQTSSNWARNVAVVNDTTAIIIADGGAISKTTDSGETWQSVFAGKNDTFYNIQLLSSTKGFTASPVGVYKTVDGKTWEYTSSHDVGIPYGLFFISETTGWISGSRIIQKTTDSGQTWNETQINSVAPTIIRKIYFVDENEGWAAANSGIILHTTDGGSTWNPQSTNASADFYSVHFYDHLNGFAVGTTGTIRKTQNGGETWEMLSPINTTYFDVQMVSTDVIYVLASSFFYKSIDGGANWTYKTFSNAGTLWNLDFTDISNGYISTSNGTVLQTQDGGENWTKMNAPVDNFLYALDALPGNQVYIGGNYGAILKYGTHYASDAVVFNVKTDQEVIKNDTVTVYVHIDQVPENQSIKAVSFEFTWDTDAIQFLDASVSPETFFGDEPLFFYVKREDSNTIDFSSGTINLEGNNQPDAVFSVQFVGTDFGSVHFSLYDVVAENKDGYNYPIEKNGADLNVIRNPNLPEFSISANFKPFFAEANTPSDAQAYQFSASKLSESVLVTAPTGFEISTQENGTYQTNLTLDPINGELNDVTVWIRLRAGIGTGDYSGDLAHVSSNEFALIWVNGSVINTNGQWFTQSSGTNSTLLDVEVINDSTAIAVGSAVVLRTSDDGQTWQMIDLGISESINDVYFLNESEGWFVGSLGTFWNTVNGGLTWTQRSVPAAIPLYSVHFFDSDNGIIGGSGGTIYKTTDGGNSWTTKQIGISSALLKMSFVDEQTGWIVGNNGMVYKTTDAFETWTQLNSNSSSTIYDVQFLNSETGFIAGTSSLLSRSDDGGNSWNSISNGFSSTTLQSIHFINEKMGWVAGFGVLAKTSDGGKTWNQGLFDLAGLPANYYAIDFYTPEKAWLVGANGYIIKYSAEDIVVEQPEIASFLPNSAVHGTEISVLGAHFGQEKGSSRLLLGTTYFLAEEVITNSWSDSEIKFTIPEVLAVGDYLLFVEVNSYVAESPEKLMVNKYEGPEIQLTSNFTPFETGWGTASEVQSYSVSGKLLESSISISAPTGFEISLNEFSDFGSALELTQNEGVVDAVTVWVRLTAEATPANYSGFISHSSQNAATVEVQLSGTVRIPKAQMEGFSPLFGNPGTEITIKGKYFGVNQDTNLVKIGLDFESSNDLAISSWTDTLLTTQIPDPYNPGIYSIFMVVRGDTLISTESFEVTKPIVPGDVDPTFNSGTGFNSLTNAIIETSDQKLLIGGEFTFYNNQTMNRICRLNSDGSLDETFTIGSGFNSSVTAIHELSDGSFLVAGSFTSYSGKNTTRLVKLLTDGTLDETFAPEMVNSTILTMQVQTDGKILMGGIFISVGSTATNYMARLNSDGTLDQSFSVGSGFNSFVRSIALQSDGKIVVGGQFTVFNGASANRIVRLNSDGSLDNSFQSGSGFNNTVFKIAIQSDEKIIVGGAFTFFNFQTSNRIIRLLTNGVADEDFYPNANVNSTVYDLLPLSGGNVLINGTFTIVNDQLSNYLALLDSNGLINDSLAIGTGFNSYTYKSLVQSDGKLIVTGSFTTYQNQAYNRIVRLYGIQSLELNPAVIASISPLVSEPEGEIVISGEQFGNTQSNSKAYLGTSISDKQELTVLEWTDTQIRVRIPNDILPGEYYLYIGYGSRLSVGGEKLTINESNIRFAESQTKLQTALGLASRAVPYSISTGSAEKTITITAADPIEISFFSNKDFTQQMVVQPKGTKVPSVTIWKRIKSSASQGAFTAEITHESEGVVTKKITINGLVVGSSDPVISTIKPQIVKSGSEIKIYGQNLGDGSGVAGKVILSNSVTEYPISFSSFSTDSIVAQLPTFSNLSTAFGTLSLSINGSTVESPLLLTVLSESNPIITELSESVTVAGKEFIVKGSLFNDVQGNAELKLGLYYDVAKPMEVLSWSNTEITVKVPSDVIEGVYRVWFHLDDYVVNSDETIQVIEVQTISNASISINGSSVNSSIVTGKKPLIQFDVLDYATDYQIDINAGEYTAREYVAQPPYQPTNNIPYGSNVALQIAPRYSVIGKDELFTADAVSVDFTVFPYQNEVNVNQVFSFSGDLNPSEFRLIGFSGKPQAITSYIPLSTDEYEVSRWNGSSFQKLTSEPKTGEGLWIIATSALAISASNTSVELDADESVQLQVLNDWNLITNPFDQSFNWDATIGGGQSIYEWNPSLNDWVESSVMEPKKGYAWRNTTGSTQLNLNYYNLIVNTGSLKQKSKSNAPNESSPFNQNSLLIEKIRLAAKGSKEFGNKSVKLNMISDSLEYYAPLLDTNIPPAPFEMSQFTIAEDSVSIPELFKVKTILANDDGIMVPLIFLMKTSEMITVSQMLNNTHNAEKAGLIHQKTGRFYPFDADSVQFNLSVGETAFYYILGKSGFVDETVESFIPKEFIVHQNYPNPFNPTTTLSFSLPDKGIVKIDVYDILGRHVATIANREFSAGYQTVQFNGQQLSSGMYLYRIQFGETVQTRKMVLVK